MQQARASWSETVDEMQVSTSPPNPPLSKSQTDFSSPKITKFLKIDDTAHFLNSSASEADIQNEFSAVSSPITAIVDYSNVHITASSSPSLDSVRSTSQKKRKVRESPTPTRSTDTFVSIESSIFDHTLIHTFTCL